MNTERRVTSVRSPTVATAVWLRWIVRMSPRSMSTGAEGSGIAITKPLIEIAATCEEPAYESVVPWQE
jgi:hypothetical protein